MDVIFPMLSANRMKMRHVAAHILEPVVMKVTVQVSGIFRCRIAFQKLVSFTCSVCNSRLLKSNREESESESHGHEKNYDLIRIKRPSCWSVTMDI